MEWRCRFGLGANLLWSARCRQPSPLGAGRPFLPRLRSHRSSGWLLALHAEHTVGPIGKAAGADPLQLLLPHSASAFHILPSGRGPTRMPAV